jgi:DNA-binding NarL/FixJ family response regulator
VGCAVLGVPHGGLSEGIQGLLATHFESVVLVADDRSLLACLDALAPDLLVLDLALLPGKALALTARMRKAHPGLRILLLVAGDDARLASAAEDAGADGCLLKADLGSELLRAVDVVLAGGTAFWSSEGPDGPKDAGEASPPPVHERP